MSVSQACSQYEALAKDWRIIDALLGGTRVMREKAELYLPKELAEQKNEYENRLSRTYLKPALREAIVNTVGYVFQNKVDTSAVNPQLLPILDDVDMLGNDITVYLSGLFFNILTYGRADTLIDSEPLSPGSSLADAQRAGLRPYLVNIDPRNVLGWRKSNQPGPEKLEQVRFRGYVPAPQGEFDDNTVIDQIYVIDGNGYQTWQLPPTGAVAQDVIDRNIPENRSFSEEWVKFGPTIPLNFDEIPFVSIYAERLDFMVGRPPFMDLAWLNLAHWQSYSDYRNILHVAQVPFLVGRGVSDTQEVVLGVSSMVKLSDPQAEIKWVEHSGAAIAAGRQELIDLEKAMEAMGASMTLQDTPGDITATQKAITTANVHSPLGKIVMQLEDGANAILYWLGRWQNISDVGRLTIRRPVSMGGNEPLTAQRAQPQT